MNQLASAFLRSSQCFDRQRPVNEIYKILSGSGRKFLCLRKAALREARPRAGKTTEGLKCTTDWLHMEETLRAELEQEKKFCERGKMSHHEKIPGGTIIIRFETTEWRSASDYVTLGDKQIESGGGIMSHWAVAVRHRLVS